MQASATISVSQRWTNFCSLVEKNFWINFATQSTLRHTAFRIFKKIVVCNHRFSFRQLLLPKNYKISAILTEVKRFHRRCHNIKWVYCLVSKLWRYVLECWELWLCDSADIIMSKKINIAGMWPWVPKKLLKWEKAKTILFHSNLILSNFLWKGKFFWQHQRKAVVDAVNLI